MRSMLFITLLFALAVAKAQPDAIPTEQGNVTMTPVLHATLVLEWNDQTIYIDPYGGAERFAAFDTPDLVIITHAHGDHYNKETLQQLELAEAELIAPESVVDDFLSMAFGKVTILVNGQSIESHGIDVEAVPMYNLPDDETSRHKKGWGNGYVLTIGGKRFYISGDTEDIPEMRDLKDIDYAFVCMNLPYTMTVESAADAVLDFKPKVVYPFHYRGQNGFSDVQKFEELVNADQNIEVRLREWYPE